MVETAEDLNYDCNYNMFLIKSLLGNLRNLGDRQRAVQWMRKLASCDRTIEEMKLRNEFVYYLVLNVQNGELRPPFSNSPPSGTLQGLESLLPGVTEIGGQMGAHPSKTSWVNGLDKPRKEKPHVYQYSPDGGAFLSQQPIPRCGAFCYLAVVNRDLEEE